MLGAVVARSYESQIGLLIYCFFCLVAYCMLTTTFAFSHVTEKEHNVKYLLKVSGCRFFPYWIGTFLADSILAIVIWGLMIGIGLLWNIF